MAPSGNMRWPHTTLLTGSTSGPKRQYRWPPQAQILSYCSIDIAEALADGFGRLDRQRAGLQRGGDQGRKRWRGRGRSASRVIRCQISAVIRSCGRLRLGNQGSDLQEFHGILPRNVAERLDHVFGRRESARPRKTGVAKFVCGATSNFAGRNSRIAIGAVPKRRYSCLRREKVRVRHRPEIAHCVTEQRNISGGCAKRFGERFHTIDLPAFEDMFDSKYGKWG
jgi:hypothetical protein